MKLASPLDPDYFSMFITSEDDFAKTFISKCKMIKAWQFSKGIINEDNELLAAIVTTYSKRLPKVANLQLLHTFSKHRKRGYAKELCINSVAEAYKNECQYFRVSAEPDAVKFYQKIGFKFIGRQKSGCQLSMFPIISPIIEENQIIIDSFIEKAIYSKRKGSCVEVFYTKNN